MTKPKKTRPRKKRRYVRTSPKRLQKYLTTWRTVAQIAKHFGWSKPSAYAQIAKLEAGGVKLSMTSIRAGARGPKSTAFKLWKPLRESS